MSLASKSFLRLVSYVEKDRVKLLSPEFPCLMDPIPRLALGHFGQGNVFLLLESVPLPPSLKKCLKTWGKMSLKHREHQSMMLISMSEKTSEMDIWYYFRLSDLCILKCMTGQINPVEPMSSSLGASSFCVFHYNFGHPMTVFCVLFPPAPEARPFLSFVLSY